MATAFSLKTMFLNEPSSAHAQSGRLAASHLSQDLTAEDAEER